MSPSSWWRGALPYLAFAVLAVGMLNFLWFMTETLPLNLIPSDGRVVDSHYFLWSKIHGGFVEVGAETYQWLRFHETSVFLTWPLVLLAGGVLLFRYFSGRIAGSSMAVEDAVRAGVVRTSGPAVASVRAGGTIGRVWFSLPLLRIEVHPGGIVVKPPLLAERTILASEITAVTPGGGLMDQSKADDGPVLGIGVSEVSGTFKPRGPFVRVDHAGVGMATPLIVAGGVWNVATAILAIAGSSSEGTASATPASQATQAASRGEDRLPRGIWTAGIVLGTIVTVVLIWAGVTYAIPQLGLPGVLWTVALILILAVNVRRYLLGSRR